MADRQVCVLLVQLGGPEQRSELRPFIARLLADPNILPIPVRPLRHAVARLIALLRAPRSAPMYEAIGWSPVRHWTERSAALLRDRLGASNDAVSWRVEAAMTCSPPLVTDVLAGCRREGVSEFVVVPLYPQYSTTTTKSAREAVLQALDGLRWHPPIHWACDAWFDNAAFVDAHADRLRTVLRDVPQGTVIVYSAHSIPVSAVERRSDPYPGHVMRTASAIDATLGTGHRSVIGFQSRLGPVPWVGPTVTDVVSNLAQEGVTSIVVCPLSFVSDHVETLYELSILLAEHASSVGITSFTVTEGLNDHPRYIEALEQIAREARASGSVASQ